MFERCKKKSPADRTNCGDKKRAKNTAARLIRDVGFNREEVGLLSMARYIEPFSVLVAQLACDCSGGPELAYRFERFPKPKIARQGSNDQMAGATGLEPAASCLTGRRSNQLNYAPANYVV